MVTKTDIRIVAAAFPSVVDAQSAVLGLKEHGFSEQDISVLYTDAGHTIRAGLLGGAIWGGVLGAFMGLIFPPSGLLVAAGPIGGALASGAALGTAGALTVGALDGLIAGLVHLGLPKETATDLAGQVHKGDTLVMAHADSEEKAAMAQQVLDAHHPRGAVASSSAAVPVGV